MPDTTQVRVALVMRRHEPGMNSVERLFSSVAEALPDDVKAEVIRLPHRSRRVVDLLRNCLFVRRLDHDVVHVTGDVNYCAILARRRKVVLTVLDLVSIHRLSGLRLWAFRTLWYTVPLLRCAHATTISEFVRCELRTSFPWSSHRVAVIPCALVFDSPAQGVRERSLLQVGTGQNKNPAAAIDIAERTGVQLRLIGKVDPALRSRISASDADIVELGVLSDEQMIGEYGRAGVLVFLSTYEGFGMPIIEAQASGLPVLAANRPPLPEVAGNGAIFVDFDDIDAAVREVERILDDTRHRETLVERGKRNCERFDRNDVAERYAQTYRLAASSPPR